MPTPPPPVTRNLKAGDILLKPGEKVKSVYFIQSGLISLCHSKNGKFVEIAQLGPGQAVADELAFGAMQWNLTVLALRPTVVLEVPLDTVLEPLNFGPLAFKNLLKALGERLKTSFSELKTVKVNRDAISCPSDRVAKVFGVIYHTARIIGKMDPTEVEAKINWDDFRRFAFEVFGESPVRIEDAVGILLKLEYAKFEGKVLHIRELKNLESFFDYYGSYYFKGGYEDLLKTNSKIQKVTEEFLKLADVYPLDRGGYCHMPYKPAIDAMKKVMGASFEADQLFRIEQKGLFIKRTATQDGGQLSFYRPDFDQMMLNWRFLREIELWNEKGFVDTGVAAPVPSGGVEPRAALDPVAERKKWAKALEQWKPAAMSLQGAPRLRKGEKAKDEVWCSVCMSVLAQGQKACAVCGAEADPARAA